MRVISGLFGSRLLQEVPSKTTRETRDRVKESIFGTIHFDCQDSLVLDLFAGSGGLGIEAISRGGKYCDFIDSNTDAIKTIQHNIKTLNIPSKTSVHHIDYHAFLENLKEGYDLIFLDPPYQTFDVTKIIGLIAKKQALKPSGTIILLSHKSEVIKPEINGIIPYKTKTKGITKITFFRWSD